MTMSVSPGELSAGVGKVAALFGDCEKATSGVAETLSGMTGVAGHPGLVGALTGVTETSTKAAVHRPGAHVHRRRPEQDREPVLEDRVRQHPSARRGGPTS
ncbi:MAG TPA: hypothetical protein VGG05_15740 [Pseudonocardiaceae bacterium]|jgi:hypothetical protein